MDSTEYDVVVIGTGPGGEGTAMQAAKNGLSVVVVEEHAKIGGGCTHWGTIPSKALRHAIFQLTETLGNPFLREKLADFTFSFQDLRASATDIIKQQEEMRHGFYVRNRVPILHGRASFENTNLIRVELADGSEQMITGKHVVIATGSRPFRPTDVDFNNERIFDSDTVLSLSAIPKSITIYGAGVVGCEYASMFRNLGVKVNLINTRDQLLEFLDDEIIDALSYHMRDVGVVIRHREQYESIYAEDDGVVVALKSGKRVKSEILLWANGRTGNTDRLKLDRVGLEPNGRGQLSVNEFGQTTNPSIYAVGDVIGFPSLASAAYTQGRIAAGHICSCDGECQAIGEIPTGIYTSPEISSVGKTEKELTEAKIPYEVGNAQFKSLARAQIIGRGAGMLKILFHRETLELLGIHCFGANASEIIHIGQAIMAQKGPGNTLMYFMNTTFNYPTMAEAYRVAALNGYNRLF